MVCETCDLYDEFLWNGYLKRGIIEQHCFKNELIYHINLKIKVKDDENIFIEQGEGRVNGTLYYECINFPNELDDIFYSFQASIPYRYHGANISTLERGNDYNKVISENKSLGFMPLLPMEDFNFITYTITVDETINKFL